MRLLAILLSVVLFCTAAYSKKKEEDVALEKENQLTLLKNRYDSIKDSLETEITDRWTRKKVFTRQRESDKERLSVLQTNQEHLYNELSRIKEIVLADKNTIERELKELSEEKDAADYRKNAIVQIGTKEADRINEIFLLDQESRRLELEKLRKDLLTAPTEIQAIKQFVSYYTAYLRKGLKIGLSKDEMLLPNKGTRQMISIARFGNTMAYGRSEDGDLYTVNQTGKMGHGRFTIDTIGASSLKNFLYQSFPKWNTSDSLNGLLNLDVLQNSSSQALLKGEETSYTRIVADFFKQGGIVMLPLALVLLWAIVLIILKFIVFKVKHKENRKLYENVKLFLKNHQIENALEYVKKNKGVVAKVVEVCLEHSQWSKQSAEKAVQEILIEETPQIENNLSTIAALAGVAPLLGLLGTVMGMIEVFKVITVHGTGDPKLLASGIAEALITTEFGLIVAIPILLFHNYLSNRCDHIQAEMQKHAVRILNRLWPKG